MMRGVYNQFKRLVLMKGVEEQTDYTLKKISRFLYECECPDCKGKRLNENTLSCKINGYNIYEMCQMEFSALRQELEKIKDDRAVTIVEQLKASLDRMIDIGPLAGKNGGQVLFQGSYEDLLISGTKTGNGLSSEIKVKEKVRSPKGFLEIRGATLHNLKNVDVDIPLGILRATGTSQ